MIRRFAPVFALVAAIVILLPALAPRPEAASAQPAGCVYQLGFRVLHDMIPQLVGDCRENEWHNALNGDGLQQTTGGLMVWRKIDNWTAFTDGNVTWINGPLGLQSRLNTERFAWEGSADAPAILQPGGSTAPAPAAITTATAPTLSLDLSDDRVEQGQSFTIRLSASSDVGIDSTWWWATSTNDSALRDTHPTNCRNASPCRHSWDASTNDTGTLTIHAKARDNNGVESDEVAQDLRIRDVSVTTTPTPTTSPKATSTEAPKATPTETPKPKGPKPKTD